jgi:Cu(I)/Ag(I) efflux system membrane protein CusA/SilA
LGVAAETGVVMLVYLDESYERYGGKGIRDRKVLKEAVLDGSVRRVRPKMMTVVTTIMGLMPLLWSTGAGADVMKRIAAPMIGGLVTSTVLTLLIIPAIYYMWKSMGIPHNDAGKNP